MFALQMPEDEMREDLAGKKIDFTVAVKEIKEKFCRPWMMNLPVISEIIKPGRFKAENTGFAACG